MQILNTVIVVLISLLVFTTIIGIIFGIIFGIISASNPDKTKRHRNIWIAVGGAILSPVLLFVLISIWGLISILSNSGGGVPTN